MQTLSAAPHGDYSGFWVRDPAFYRNLFALAVPIVLQNLITEAIDNGL